MKTPATLAPKALDFAGLIRAGDTVFWAQATAEPVFLTSLLNDQAPRCPPFRLFFALTFAGDFAPDNPNVTVTALGGGGAGRRFFTEGAGNVIPANISGLCDLIAAGRPRIDVVLLQVSGPDAAGNYNAGVGIECLREAIAGARLVIAQINPSFPPAIMFLAVNDQRDGKLREAVEKYKQVIRDTDDAVYQNAAMRAMAFGNMGHAYRELGELANARSSLESAARLYQKSFQVWMDLGVVSQRMGDPAEAAHAYEQAVGIQPYDVGYLLLARALEQLGQSDKAAKALQQAKLLTNDYERAQKKAAELLDSSN